MTLAENDLGTPYMANRGADQAELQYQTDIEEARRMDQEEKFVGEMEQFKQVEQAPEPQASDEGKPLSEGAPKDAGVMDEITQIGENLPANITTATLDALENVQSTLFGRGNSEKLNQQARDNVPGYAALDDMFVSGREILRKEGPVDHMVQMMWQFGLPWTMAQKALQTTTGATSFAGKVAVARSAEGVTAYAAMSPHMERFAPILQELGVESGFINYISSEEGSDAENRFKTTLDTMAAFTVAAPFIWAASQGLKAAYREATLSKASRETRRQVKGTKKLLKKAGKPQEKAAKESTKRLKKTLKKLKAEGITEESLQAAEVVKRAKRVTPKNLNKDILVTEKVMVSGVEKTIKRKAGDVLKDMDKRYDMLEAVLEGI